jgi:hypothetical protein
MTQHLTEASIYIFMQFSTREIEVFFWNNDYGVVEIDKCLKYFEDREEYEFCKKILDARNNLRKKGYI